MHEEIMPLWEAYEAIATEAIEIPLAEELVRWNGLNEGIVLFEEGAEPSRASHSDGKWLYQDGTLWASAWAEKVPPLRLRMSVPPGTYTVQVRTLAAMDYQVHPATSFVLMVENDSRRIRITHPTALTPQTGFAYRTVGTYTVDDGDFDVVISSDHPSFWGTVCGFRFVPIDTPVNRAESDTAASEESIRALGYIR